MPTPDTALTRAADALLTTASPPLLVNHCKRTFIFATALLHRGYDVEALYVASMLHDLGMTASYEDGVTPFERRGAEAAADALRALDADSEFVSLVHDAIALHLEVTTAKDPRPEVAGVSLGAAVDVLGLRLDQIPPKVLTEALERFPRGDLKPFLIEAMQREARLKPHSRIAQHVAQFGFTELIANAPFAS
ncbi:HD domain-containing protein [Allorhizocola rhizosphaerae]|uniref:HD domain-containing protein n=1 Tax=Allorhizocola rhizosphaerae TaxID=1872709 RepID=UPI000E3DF14A|nr:HD domain-containing protein [Allorhizocola rhizosphaerae]